MNMSWTKTSIFFRYSFSLYLLSLCLLVLSCDQEEQHGEQTSPEPAPAPTAALDKTDPTAVAEKVLLAYKAQDLATLSTLSTAYNQEMLSKIQPGSSRYKSIFSPDKWRMKAVQAWIGDIESIRVSGTEAQCLFGSISPSEVVVVTLKKENGEWRFEDINSPSKTSYESWGEKIH